MSPAEQYAGGKLLLDRPREHVVRLTIYVKSRDDYVAKLKPLGEVYRRYLGGHYPAMALFEVRIFSARWGGV